jgi:glutaryl-CoA dehydrogenase
MPEGHADAVNTVPIGWAGLAERVDLERLRDVLETASVDDLEQALHRLERDKQVVTPPPVNGDFYDIADAFDETEQRMQRILRDFFAKEVHPIINDYWDRGEFPTEIIPKFADLVEELYGPYEPGMSFRRSGVTSLELGRGDPSLSTFFGVHWGLCMGSIERFGSPEQKDRWLPAMYRFEKIGSWALTEPLVGSAAASGLGTTATRDGDTWTLNGDKKWSGNATIADVNVIWANDTADRQVKGFLVERDTPGYHVEKVTGKIAKRAIDNVLIRLDDVKVHESQRLPGVNSFRDVAGQLASGRAGVAWEAVGIAMAAYEYALDYCNNRWQFGKPITSFQLVQAQLVEMLGNVTAMLSMMKRLGELEKRDGTVSAERASLAKAWCTEKMRETVAIARGVVGGNGILLEHQIARYFADAEAVYSYEGSHEMNTLIVGRAITGISAFV